MCGFNKIKSMNKLVDYLINGGVITSEKVALVLRKVDRKEFCIIGTDYYGDYHQPINFKSTITPPHMHGFVLLNFVLITFLIGVTQRCTRAWGQSSLHRLGE